MDYSDIFPYNEILTWRILRLVNSSQSAVSLQALFHGGAKGLTGEEEMRSSQKDSEKSQTFQQSSKC